jgi:ribonuclease PH
MRKDGRKSDEIRPVNIERGYLSNAEGSALITMGGTKVLCSATLEEGIPRFLYGSDSGWITAEYGMLPRSSQQRIVREAARGRSGRTYEIQRLIGRSFRAAVQLDMLGEITVIIDCDVIEADGGTRTASITGGCIALYDAIASVGYSDNPINYLVSAISVGIVDGNPLLDLNYEEDSSAQVDLNVVMAESGAYIEVQGTAEKYPFTPEQLQQMLDLARSGCEQLFQAQRSALGIEE